MTLNSFRKFRGHASMFQRILCFCFCLEVNGDMFRILRFMWEFNDEFYPINSKFKQLADAIIFPELFYDLILIFLII